MAGLDDPDIFRTVLESLQTGVYLVDRNQKILFWNDGAERITGYLRQDVVGRLCRDNLLVKSGPTTGAQDAADVLASVFRDGRATIAEITLRHKAGHRIPVRMRAVAIRDAHGSIIGAAETFEESLSASDWDRRQTKLFDYGCIDRTTGVLTHEFVLSQLREHLAMFAKHPVPLSILCVEIDRLEHLKVTYGPAVISPVLSVVAQTLENNLRPTDFLGRYQEHQFLAILTECSSSEIERVADRLRKMVVCSDVAWWGDELSVTCSFGGTSAKSGDSMESILERAGEALRTSGDEGGNRITVLP
jgi:diguanylate cyclase (GGDEF)-like protein/PAS domain S-box-containing protein